MSRIPKQASLRGLALLVAAIFVACAEPPLVAPDADVPAAAQLATVPGGVMGALPDLGSCQNLLPREAATLFFQVFARGVQIYRWSGSAWVFAAPDATLYPNARANARDSWNVHRGAGERSVHYGLLLLPLGGDQRA